MVNQERLRFILKETKKNIESGILEDKEPSESFKVAQEWNRGFDMGYPAFDSFNR